MIDANTRARHATLAQRRLVLDLLQRFGPMPATDLPRVWPLTRQQVAAIVRDLAEAGALSFGWDPAVPGRRRLHLTPGGARLLAALDDDAMATLASAVATVAPVAAIDDAARPRAIAS